MKYDVLHLPGVTPPGCGRTWVSPDLGDDHHRGDRLKLACRYCRGYGTHEVRGRLGGLA